MLTSRKLLLAAVIGLVPLTACQEIPFPAPQAPIDNGVPQAPYEGSTDLVPFDAPQAPYTSNGAEDIFPAGDKVDAPQAPCGCEPKP